MIATNKTSQPQQINFLEESKTVLPGEKIEFKEDELYSHELERIGNFFSIVKPEKKQASKQTQIFKPNPPTEVQP